MVAFYVAVLHKISRKFMEVGELPLIKARAYHLISPHEDCAITVRLCPFI